MDFVIIYLLLINALACILMLADKLKAKRNLWRIPESTLIGIAIAGGSLGILVGMYAFHHKTLHAKFHLGIPAIFAVQIVGLVIVFSHI